MPPPLPPQPTLDLVRLVPPLGRAERALGRLDGITLLLPDDGLFLYMYVRKEAVLSSQIEGTQSTLGDLLRFEVEARAGDPIDDIREVSNYADAMMFALECKETLPLSLRLLREIHARLLASGRGRTMTPGEFRRTQNWIGGTRPGNAHFVPPPVSELDRCLGELEDFFHETKSKLPVLLKAGLIHVQFESIHPFLDGNGRLGRLLVTLYLCLEGVLQKPLLYLSLHFKTHRARYYQLLQEIRTEGNWEEWLDFFLEAVAMTADSAFEAAGRIVELFRIDRERIQTSGQGGVGSALRVHEVMRGRPYLTSKQAVMSTGLSAPTANAALLELERLGIAQEVTGRRRGKVYGYGAYLDILNEGTDPLPG